MEVSLQKTWNNIKTYFQDDIHDLHKMFTTEMHGFYNRSHEITGSVNGDLVCATWVPKNGRWDTF